MGFDRDYINELAAIVEAAKSGKPVMIASKKRRAKAAAGDYKPGALKASMIKMLKREGKL